MIKAYFVKDGQPILLLGLSHANLDRLREYGLSGHILIKAADFGLSHDIVITAAKSEQVIAQYLAPYIGPDTKVHIDKKLKQ
jgi:hypothetical protein